ncbi:hypothetical protein [Streptomyces sp. V3I7]|uniref:hypothetical protein n=1 Tax=Streptomyces sp. V3I7 TaxID=3042278 RepID=UPI0027879D7B|nr:hypothetical protein [Streptomyces sp. V3I7]MDQ0992854.1 hypothetical protein [Streptomyces sp. V3I7]
MNTVDMVVDVLGAVLVALLVVSGVAAIASGWILPIGRQRYRVRILRPRLWGCATLVFGIGAAVMIFRPFGFPYDLVGLAMFLSGLALRTRSERPGPTA